MSSTVRNQLACLTGTKTERKIESQWQSVGLAPCRGNPVHWRRELTALDLYQAQNQAQSQDNEKG